MMAARSPLFGILLVVLALPRVGAWGLSCFKCPTDDKYDPACLKSAIPPWPICLFHDVKFFVDTAMDGATRCCGEDTSECRCPKKETGAFKDHIGDWCKGVASCKSDLDTVTIPDEILAAALN
uniref:Uncharacterized protein n=1 Tax=Odontella aurita TaxID=265563 RepID=A0A7S4IJP6_9STRA|mmetsp:Transcript_26146/g.77380  ORF Transcript_26146/g.77380 Transcript_26146/m.77380 type:complete len:123 (+) Transcript_26146:12-380(+)